MSVRSVARRRWLSVAAASALLALALATIVTAPPQCTAPAERPVFYPYRLRPMFGGRSFEKPVQALQHPTDPDTWYVVVHRGLVERVRDDGVTTVLDITDRAAFGRQFGLQSIVLHPDFPRDRRLFALYSIEGPAARLSVFRADESGDVFDPASEKVLLTEGAPVAWHSAGDLAFGPDGMLYASWGDGQEARDDSLRGKILRIDVDGDPYGIPPDNPFSGERYPRESYAVGLRMPWRFSFDRLTGELWAGDVGQHSYEEIDRILPGRDYGWPVWEGLMCAGGEACATTPFEPPVYQLSSSEACSVIGGYVYRGRKLPELYGDYVYADYCTRTIRALDLDVEPPVSRTIAHSDLRIVSFAEDRDGELYVVESAEERSNLAKARSGFHVLSLEASEGAANRERLAASAASGRLSSTGCISPRGFRHAPPGLIFYGVNQSAWADGATVHRFATVLPMYPPIWGIDVDVLKREPGSILIKTFAVAERPVETQMLVRRQDGHWDAFDYLWTSDGRDAVTVTQATEIALPDGRSWQLPGPDQCARCHAPSVGDLLAFTAPQLNRTFEGRDQIGYLEALGTVRWPWKGGPIPVLSPIDDPTASIEDRARAYLEVNCAHCHQPAGSAGSTRMDLRRTTPFALVGVCGEQPTVVLPDHADAALLEPGDPQRSLLYLRMIRSDAAGMPPQRRAVDGVGAALVAEWIRSIRSCDSGPATALSDGS